jgi:hypothetical protein
MTKLILIEGIPGSGKTTLALRLEKYLNENSFASKCILEGDPHPADLAWCGVLNQEEFQNILTEYPEYKNQLENFVIYENGKFIIPYLALKPYNKNLVGYLEEREPYSGKLSSEDFLSLNAGRWGTFAGNAVTGDKVYIFECAFLQNHLNELLLYHEPAYEYILDYFKRLSQVFASLDPAIIYLDQVDNDKTLKRAAEERISDDASMPNWIDRVIDYINGSPYGTSHSLEGYEGTLEYFKFRVGIEHRLLKDLSMKTFIIRNEDYQWDDIFTGIIRFINPLLI